MRILRVQIAHGYHSEARVDAAQFAHLTGGDMVLTLLHDWHGRPDREATRLYTEHSGSQVVLIDTGWRPWGTSRKGLAERLLAFFRLIRSVSTMAAWARLWRPDVIDST